MKEESLYEFLTNYASRDIVPLHMPGHKRQVNPYAPSLPYDLDVTEVTDTDHLHEAKGILHRCAERAQSLWKADSAYLLINGSTCGILAGICGATKYGDSILMMRNCHKSVYHAVMLNRLIPYWLIPEIDANTGIYGSITPESVETALKQHPECRLIVITSPSYEGVISDISEIAKVVHKHRSLLLVDAAHGAHLPFQSPALTPVEQPDLLICSLHKTLPALNQTALLLQYGSNVKSRLIENQLTIFETSSPSYPLLASMDACFFWLKERGMETFASYKMQLSEFSKQMTKLNHLSLPWHTSQLSPIFWEIDKGKIVISTCNTEITGGQLAEILYQEYKIETEMTSVNYVLAMTSVSSPSYHFERLSEALLDIDHRLHEGTPRILPSLPIPKRKLPIWEASQLDGQKMPLESVAGATSLEYVWAYPPGIPLLVPGEIIPNDFESFVLALQRYGIQLHSTERDIPRTLNVS